MKTVKLNEAQLKKLIKESIFDGEVGITSDLIVKTDGPDFIIMMDRSVAYYDNDNWASDTISRDEAIKLVQALKKHFNL